MHLLNPEGITPTEATHPKNHGLNLRAAVADRQVGETINYLINLYQLV